MGRHDQDAGPGLGSLQDSAAPEALPSWVRAQGMSEAGRSGPV